MNFLTFKQFSPKHLLKGDDYVQKETDSIHNALFLPVTVVSSFVYYATHTDIENEILIYLAGVFGVIYYILSPIACKNT